MGTRSARWALVGMVVLGAGCANSHKSESEEEGNEVKMTLDQVPPAAREALVREANGATITTVDREDNKGKTVYESDVMMNGKNWEIKVDGNGKLVSKKLDPEEKK
jgi:uncharacterized membrane protein YkoI